MKFDFSNLEMGSTSTVWLDLPEVSPRARVQLRPATDANPAYFNAMMKRSGRQSRNMVRAERFTAEELGRIRDDDRFLFPRYVVVGWDGIEDLDTKSDVPFSRQACEEFLNALHDWVFDLIRNAASTPERFMPDGEGPDPETISGN